MRIKCKKGYLNKHNYSSALKLEHFKASLNNDKLIIVIDKMVNDKDGYVITGVTLTVNKLF